VANFSKIPIKKMIANRPLAKVKNSPPWVPPSFGGKPEKLGSRTATSGRVGEGSGAFLQEV